MLCGTSLHLLQMNSYFLQVTGLVCCAAEMHSSVLSTMKLLLSAGNTLSEVCYEHAHLFDSFIPWSRHSHPVITCDTQNSLCLSHLSSHLEKKFLINPEVHTLTYCSNQTFLPIYEPVKVKKVLIYDGCLLY